MRVSHVKETRSLRGLFIPGAAPARQEVISTRRNGNPPRYEGATTIYTHVATINGREVEVGEERAGHIHETRRINRSIPSDDGFNLGYNADRTANLLVTYTRSDGSEFTNPERRPYDGNQFMWEFYPHVAEHNEIKKPN